MDAIDFETTFSTRRHVGAAGRAARSFVVVTLLMAFSAAGIWLLLQIADPVAKRGTIPVAFGITTAALLLVSYAFHRAVACVRRERQRPFRWWLLTAAVGGVVFASVQSFGLLAILPADRAVLNTTSGVDAFLIATVFMHGLHVVMAFFFTARVIVEAHLDRYDHEYYWGVRACAMLWHALGIAWLLVLSVLSIAMQG